jgi:hypothetical protein
MAERALSITPHHKAYSRFRRLKNALWFIREMSKRGSTEFEGTKSLHVGKTYGLEQSLIKRLKAKFRNELSFPEGGK